MSRRRPRGGPDGRSTLRRRILLAAWLICGGVLVARAAQLQVVQGSTWRGLAMAQHQTSTEVPAERGTITDRSGVPLAVSRETYRVAVAPREVQDAGELRRRLQEVLGIGAATARRVTDPSDPWHVLPGRFDPEVREALAGLPGVHLERRLERFYPHGELARGILGSVIDRRGSGGVEEAHDSLLRGLPGQQILARNNEGRPIPGEVFQTRPPRPGGTVRLTLDLDLQEIAQEALAEAVEETGARGGDLLVSDPRTGEVLALASIHEGNPNALSAINAPYEPGSTLKPFTVAALLKNGLASLSDTVDAEQGYWVAPGGKALRDVHTMGRVTLADALRESSNVGVAKAAAVLTPEQQYVNLRDFGFGVPTGVPLPGEVAGLLRRPDGWTRRSPVSLAIGYEVAVTPLQMLMAYGALANGGVLMEPRLIREVRDGEGALVDEPTPRRVRRAAPKGVARAIGQVLVDVVEDGTGARARMTTFQVAGKSGTSRAYVAGSGYESNRYYASFAGFFPADDPQLVVFVKLNEPVGPYYGGVTAAPVTRATLEAVLAARQTPIDRRALLKVVRSALPERPDLSSPPSATSSLRFASLPLEGTGGPAERRGRSLPSTGSPGGVGWASLTDRPASPDGAVRLALREPAPVPIPDVRGLPGRVAVRRLHALGLRVRWEGAGDVVGLRPSPGARVAPGDTVVVRGGQE